MTAYSLTPGQADLVRIFAELHDRMGCAPTVNELAHEMCVTKGQIALYLAALEARGWIARLPGRARGVTLLHRLPVLDDVEVGLTEAGETWLAGGASPPRAPRANPKTATLPSPPA